MATISQLMEGKVPGSVKVRREGWPEGVYFVPHFVTNGGNIWHGVNQVGYYDYCSTNMADWTLYTAPKPKVAMYLWAVQTISGKFIQSNTYYATEDDVKVIWPSATWCQRLDYTKIEVEEDV